MQNNLSLAELPGKPHHYQHKFRCMKCRLHFIVLTEHEDWPQTDVGGPDRRDTALGLVYCPECGSTSSKAHWKGEEDLHIYQVVPGADFKEVEQEQ